MRFFQNLSPSQHKQLITTALVVFVWLLFFGLSYTKTWGGIENKEFDSLTVFTSSGKSTLPITIIGIDEASFAAMGIQWPWPRSIHARLIDRLVKGGAAVIAFDMQFSERSSPAEDQKLADAIKNAGTVILAADQSYEETLFTKQWIRVEPLPLFLNSGGVAGLTTAMLDSDLVVRQVPDSQDAFWRKVIDAFQQAHPGAIEDVQAAPGSMIRYLGPTHTFPYLSYAQVVNGDASIPDDFFQDQIVLIGRDVRASPEAGSAQADTFSTPFLNYTKWLTPGVEIHATVIENIINQQTIGKAGRKIVIMLLTAVIFLAVAGLIRWHPLYSGVYFLILLAGTAGLGWRLFDHYNYWLPIASSMSAVITIYIGMAMLSYFLERRRGREIKSAFSRYVSADVVDEMIAHPERLRLGGERRELTLLFSDMAGFTSISEKLQPDIVAKLINAYLTEMTKIVMAYGGTVDKFIGDAVMAFWGAPLDDAMQAIHACEAARDMQVAMAGLVPLYEEYGVQNVAIRIGLHTGFATVGNMGSEERFDYTALGDTVNLAARLEGINKLYGTGILLSADTAAQLDNKLPLRLVDNVRVKGKQLPTKIFTISENVEFNDLTKRAIDEYRSRNWDASMELWTEISKAYPADKVAKVYLERIKEFREQEFADDWDGSVALDKM
jgi:adenylate cyclase